ncbi:Glycosyl transferases group 1 [Lentibacillus persicus]|uniref:Glycosyl transferases group 1 n=1 Tax=Lentibacillus persicus TaxID=640948 RepID=A0A1I1YEA1_9BACI|nr:glycosyltransferase [Lentibacillus persicus]SFE16250.1 Glycosyl transferases group 1 [Lentibacillus persicus]
MVHILLIAEDTSRHLNKNFFYLEKELTKRIHLTLWRKPGHIRHILKQLPRRPDFILLLNDLDRKIHPMIKGLGHINIPTGLFINDVHRFTKLRKNFIEKNDINHLFTVVRDKFLMTYPEYEMKMEWFPHFVNPNLYKDYGLTKDINLLMMGAVNDNYPLRQTIINAYQGDADFIYHSHPGYRHFSKEEENQHFIGKTYAKELNRSRIFFTSPSVLNYPVIKYFEVLACRSLLLAPAFKELKDLGFIPNFHFVPINEHNFKEKAAYYLAHETERQQIADQGYRFIHERHTVQQRTEQLIKRIEKILEQ